MDVGLPPATTGRRPQPAADPWRSVRDVGILVAVALVLAFLIKTFLFQAFYIPSGSMENTLRIGDRVVVNKLGHLVGAPIQRGQIVVFGDPGGWISDHGGPPAPTDSLRQALVFAGLVPSDRRELIKRVVAVGGDRVQCCENGALLVNGAPLAEPYVFPGDPAATVDFDITVPAGRLWVMGDHRAASYDSSKHLGDVGGGSVAAEQVVGRAVAVIWPLDRLSALSVPETFRQPALATTTAAVATGPALLGGGLAVPAVLLWRRTRRSRDTPRCRRPAALGAGLVRSGNQPGRTGRCRSEG